MACQVKKLATKKIVTEAIRCFVKKIAEYAKEVFGFEKVLCYCDCPDMANKNIVLLDDNRKKLIAADSRGFLMGSGELLHMAKRERSLQIAESGNLWHHAYEPPFVGFRGAVALAAIWVN